jgi:hypothetical protein
MTNIHASCVMLHRAGQLFDAPADAGILLLGESGAGKSTVALKLLARGARLVADDRVELFARDGRLWGRPPASLAGLIEARGVGIVEIDHAPEACIALAVRLATDAPRMPERQSYAPPEGLPPIAAPPLLELCAMDAAIAEKIVLAAASFAHALFREEGKRR